jgi:hypothetical protein
MGVDSLSLIHFAQHGCREGTVLRATIPTVSLGVTYAVVCTYGCDDGRIGSLNFSEFVEDQNGLDI